MPKVVWFVGGVAVGYWLLPKVVAKGRPAGR